MEPPRGVPVSNPPRLRDFPGFPRPRLRLSRQPTGRQRPAGRERQRELGRAVPSRRRERPHRGRLETVQEVLHRAGQPQASAVLPASPTASFPSARRCSSCPPMAWPDIVGTCLLEAWAGTLAREKLAESLPQRWAHVQGVARQARTLRAVVGRDFRASRGRCHPA